MPRDPEYIGKAHEKLTRDLLNGDDPKEDTLERLRELDEGKQERVRLGSEKTAEFIRGDVPFTVEAAEEVGDELRGVSGDSTDLIVRGTDSDRRYSLKMVSSGDVNVRNPTLNTICQNLLGRTQDAVLRDSEEDDYDETAERYAANEIDSNEFAAVVLPILVDELRDVRDRDEQAFRERLEDELRIDSHTVACKVTPAGYFHGIVSTTQGPVSKLRNQDTALDIYTEEENSTSIFFDLDGERAFKIDVYGQHSGGERRPGLRAAYRIPVSRPDE